MQTTVQFVYMKTISTQKLAKTSLNKHACSFELVLYR